MSECHGLIRRPPLKSVRVKYAQRIVALFPYLQDPYSQHGMSVYTVILKYIIVLKHVDEILCLHVLISRTFIPSREWFRIPCMAPEDHSVKKCSGKWSLTRQTSQSKLTFQLQILLMLARVNTKMVFSLKLVGQVMVNPEPSHTDEKIVREKMKTTFSYCHSLVND